MSERDDGVRGDHPAGAPHPRDNGLLPESSANSALPADLAAVQADDALLDALRGPNPPLEGSDARLTQVLMAWRREVDSEPMPRLMDTDTALAVVARARRPAPRRSSVLVPFAAAAAVLVIAFSGLGIGARTAEPGDRLFALTKVLFSEYAQEAKVRAYLEEASKAAAEGRVEDAQVALTQARDELRAVDDPASHAQLKMQAAKVQDQLLVEGPGADDDGAGAASSNRSEPTPWQDSRTSSGPSTSDESSESSSGSEAVDPGKETGGTTNTGETGDTGGAEDGNRVPEDAGPRYAPPPEFAPPPWPTPSAPPEWSPER